MHVICGGGYMHVIQRAYSIDLARTHRMFAHCTHVDLAD
jgi:hypothetical protein